MGGADDRSTSYYGGPQGPRCGPPSSAGSAGQGGSSRDFHYVTGPDHHFRSGSSSSRQSRNSSSTGSSNYHSPHVVPSSAGKNFFLNYEKSSLIKRFWPSEMEKNIYKPPVIMACVQYLGFGIISSLNS